MNWLYELYDSNNRRLGTIGLDNHLPVSSTFVVNKSLYEVTKSHFNKFTDYNSDLTVRKIGTINIAEQLYPDVAARRL
ncbi:hypothetical protein [Robertmurraya siralis]|uniref:hypothetical protein n=1 Tax=Robertmurraya siralis TaxID=77777 RepID=UPI0010F90C0B|nr:hypothetical protein [Robertmurraya siralis]